MLLHRRGSVVKKGHMVRNMPVHQALDFEHVYLCLVRVDLEKGVSRSHRKDRGNFKYLHHALGVLSELGAQESVIIDYASAGSRQPVPRDNWLNI